MAGNGGYAVNITAVDAATKTIDAVNKRIAAINAPAERLNKSLGKLADSTGITKLSGGMQDVARSSLQAFENMGRMAGPLGAITGAASIAGLVRLSTEWANLGSQLGFSAARGGIAVDQLNALQGAARLAGASAQSLTAGMTSLNDNLTNAAAGRSPEAVMAFNYLGVSLRNANGQLKSSSQVLPQVADGLAKIKNPTIQAQLATMLFGGAAEDLLPFLRRGSAGIAEYTEKARSYGVFNQRGAEAANDLREKQAELSLAVQGLGLSISQDLAPVLGPMLTDLSTWIRDNRDLIGQDVAGWVKKAVPEVKSLAGDANDVAQALGGWKPVIEGILGLRLGAWVAGLNPLVRGLALAAVAFEKAREGFSGENLPVGSPLWQFVPDKEQEKYPNSPQSQARLHPNGQNPNPFSWTNPGSWLGHGSGAQGIPRGIRNNNPLNLSFVPGQPGVMGSDGLFGTYPTMAAGVSADMHQLILNQQRGATTLAQQITKWAPPGENDTAGYIGDVSRAMGLNPNAKIDVTNPETARQLIGAMAYHENGEAVADKDIATGVGMALGPSKPGVQGGSGVSPGAPSEVSLKGGADLRISIAGAPPGTSSVATTDGNVFTGAPLVEQAMPLGMQP